MTEFKIQKQFGKTPYPDKIVIKYFLLLIPRNFVEVVNGVNAEESINEFLVMSNDNELKGLVSSHAHGKTEEIKRECNCMSLRIKTT
jgi:hypothetical protein